MGIETYSTTASSNTALFGENWTANVVNDRLRTLSADLATWYHDAGWIDYGTGSGSGTGTANTYTYASGTQFTIAANVTGAYHVGRAVRAVGSATGTIYGVITASTYSAPNTTVTVEWFSGSMSNETITISLSVHSTGSTSNLQGYPLRLRTDSADRIIGDSAGRVRVVCGGQNSLSVTHGNAEVRQSIAGSTTYGPSLELFRTNTGNALSLDTNGDCALGQIKWTGPDSAGTKVDYLVLRAVARNTAAGSTRAVAEITSPLEIRTPESAGANAPLVLHRTHPVANLAKIAVFRRTDGSGNVNELGSISVVNSETCAYNTTSDRRLKTDLVAVDDDALGMLAGLRAYWHGWATDPDADRMISIMAQDQREVAPWSVSERSDGYLQSDPAKLVPLLVAAVNTLAQRVKELERVNAGND